MSRKTAVLFSVLLLVAAFGSAQSFSPSTAAPAGPAQSAPVGGCGDTTITQSVTQNIVQFNSVSCNASGLHTDNYYYRAFDLGTDFAITNDFDVCNVQVAVETATGATGTQPIEIRLYSGPAGFPTGFPGSFTMIGSTATTVADMALAFADFPVAGTVPAGEELVVEVFTPNGQVAGNSFFIGSNPDGENDPSYLAAADCGIVSPTATGAIGFPGMQIVINVDGIANAPVVPPTEIPTVNTIGLALLALLILGISTALIRRRRTA